MFVHRSHCFPPVEVMATETSHCSNGFEAGHGEHTPPDYPEVE